MKNIKQIDVSKNAVKPFWSWNDKLNIEELCKQMDQMKSHGIDGFFMHARGGLETEYMSDEWMNCIKACIEHADETDMQAWAYDENGWPSGFANGIVPKSGEDYQQKWLVCSFPESAEELPENLIGVYRILPDGSERIKEFEKGCMAVSYDVNIYYIDTFNKDAIACFIENTHQKYYEKMPECFGNGLKGFFTDEPQYGNNGHAPWSQVLPELFEQRYGYSLLESLPMLFIDNSKSASVRSDFYNLVSDQFNESFIKQMYDWCTEHNCKLTGHMMNEENLNAIMSSTAGVMSCYDYFHEPGIDWLGRKIETPFVPKQLGSAAAQLERKTMTETYALCGWDVSLNELKWIGQWQYVNGVTSLCPHLEGYSMRGCRKRDYPASLFTQLPWFDKAYRYLSDYFTRLGSLLDEGKDYAPLLVMHPLQSAYTVYNPQHTNKLTEMDEKFRDLSEKLNGQHILYHFGDEILMGKYGSVDGDTLSIGACDYKAVFLPDIINLKSKTAEMLLAFAQNGGKIFTLGRAPFLINGREDSIVDSLAEYCIEVFDLSELKQNLQFLGFADIVTEHSENSAIHYCERIMPDGNILLYFVNLSAEKQSAKITLKDGYSLELYDLNENTAKQISSLVENKHTYFELDFDIYGSAVIMAQCSDCSYSAKAQNYENIVLDNIFAVKHCTENAFTLDYCEYRIDDGDWQEEMPVILLQNKLLELQHPCKIDQRFTFEVRDNINTEDMCLCMETPERFTVSVNGYCISDVSGCFIDHSIKRLPIGDKVISGKNEIIISGEFTQNQNVYDVLFTPDVHECEKNKLTYDTELESIYLVGDFAVATDSDYSLGEKKSVFTGHDFYICEKSKSVDIRNITPQGFWFFAGELTLEQKVNITIKDNVRYRVSFEKLYSPAAVLKVNGKTVGLFAFAPYALDVTDYLTNGENTIEVILLSGNRNLFGPHHRPYGESYSVTPATFTDKPDWAYSGNGPLWTDNYSFVLFGAE